VNAARGRLARWSRNDLLLWLTPPIVAALVYVLSLKQSEYAIGACIALLLLAFMSRRPGGALIALVIFLPVEQVLFGLLLGFHVPASFLRQASGFKELMVLSVLVAAVLEIRRTSRRLDAIDKVVLIYVGVVTAYLVAPHLFSSVAPTQWNARLLAWRSDCGYVLMFFAVRHAPMSAHQRHRFVQAIMAMGALITGAGLYQRLRPGSWQHFLLHRDHQIQYLQNVLHENYTQIVDVLRYPATLHPLHVGSILISPYDMSDYLLVVGGITLERIVRDRRSLVNYLLMAAVVATLFFSRVRADALALLFMLVLAALPSPKRAMEGRIRVIAAILVGAAFIVPSLGGSRFVGAQGGSASSTGHIKEIDRGISIFEHYPTGIGLGAQPGTVNYLPGATGGATDLTTDNSVTQVADELGIQALLPWAMLMVAVLLALQRRSRTGDEYTGAAFLALVGVLVAGQYHHVFILYPVPWTLWALVGLGLVRRDGTHISSARSDELERAGA
jgi:hypothetical protein